MRVTVKICGLTTPTDARAAAVEGADFLGFVFFPESSRSLETSASSWIRVIEGVPKVGVFRDEDEATVRKVRVDAALDLVQLHGSEPPEMCEALGGRARVIKAISVGQQIDLGKVAEYAWVARVLFDTASPSGGGAPRRARRARWPRAAGRSHRGRVRAGPAGRRRAAARPGLSAAAVRCSARCSSSSLSRGFQAGGGGADGACDRAARGADAAQER